MGVDAGKSVAQKAQDLESRAAPALFSLIFFNFWVEGTVAVESVRVWSCLGPSAVVHFKAESEQVKSHSW